jgi:hypothetical protein
MRLLIIIGLNRAYLIDEPEFTTPEKERFKKK